MKPSGLLFWLGARRLPLTQSDVSGETRLSSGCVGTLQRNRRSKIPALVVIGAVVGVLALAYATGVIDVFRDTDRMRDLMTESGPLGPVVFILGFAAMHTVGVPALAFVFAAGLLWATPWAMLLSWAGALAGTMAGFAFARWLGRDWVAGRLPEGFRRYDDRLAAHAVPTVIAVRLATFLAPPADWFFGVSAVRTREFAIGTAIGIVPAIALVTVFGDGVADRLESGSPLVLALLALVAGALVVKRVLRRRAAVSAAD